VAQRLFYLTTIPGLEPTAYLELCERWRSALAFFPEYKDLSFPTVHYTTGALEFKAPMKLMLFLYPHLRIPQRLLLRELTFLAENERAFLKGLNSVPWSDFFSKGETFDIKFTSRSSKISMSGQVQECLEKVLKPLKVSYKKGGQPLFVRIFRDQCTVSIDCTGESAYKRGEGAKGSVASLRATTASGLLQILLQGVREPVHLVDPMCGSGTFLNEALNLNKPLVRDYAFQKFPLYLQGKKDSESIEWPESESKIAKVFGYDLHAKAVTLAQNNLQSQDPTKWQVEQVDLFQNQDGRLPDDGRPVVVILNPPWGKRLQATRNDILQQAYQKYRPKRLGLLMPSHWKMSPIGLEKVRDRPLLNSGIENRFVVFA